MGFVAVGAAVATVAGSVIQSDAAKSAAKTQANAENNATAQQQKNFDTTLANTQPFINSGQSANNLLQAELPNLSSPVQMNEAQLQQTPGYQFNLTQGLKATQNAAAARGLGVSGAALKGAAQYATGLADSTYQNQFNNAVTNKTNAYNMLSGATTIGANAANGLGTTSSNVGANIAGTTVGAGNAQAAGQIGQANAISGGLNGLQSAFYANKILGGNNNGLYGDAYTPAAGFTQSGIQSGFGDLG